MIAITYNDLLALKPCEDGLAVIKRKIGGPRKWGDRKIGADEARKAGTSFDNMVWVANALAHSNADVERRLRLWMADCAARVLHIYEKTGKSNAPRNAIIAARRYARGEIGGAAWDVAGHAAWCAARAAAAAVDAAWDAAVDAAGDAAGGAAWAAARAAEEGWQYDRLVARLSDDEPDDWPLPEAQS